MAELRAWLILWQLRLRRWRHCPRGSLLAGCPLATRGDWWALIPLAVSCLSPGCQESPLAGAFPLLLLLQLAVGLRRVPMRWGGREGTGLVLDGRWRKDAGRRGIPESREEGNGTAQSQLFGGGVLPDQSKNTQTANG